MKTFAILLAGFATMAFSGAALPTPTRTRAAMAAGVVAMAMTNTTTATAMGRDMGRSQGEVPHTRRLRV